MYLEARAQRVRDWLLRLLLGSWEVKKALAATLHAAMRRHMDVLTHVTWHVIPG